MRGVDVRAHYEPNIERSAAALLRVLGALPTTSNEAVPDQKDDLADSTETTGVYITNRSSGL